MTSRVIQSTSKLLLVTTSSFTSKASLKHALSSFSTNQLLTKPHILSNHLVRTARYSTFDRNLPEAMEAVKQTVAQNLGVGGSHTLVPEDQQFNLNQTPDLKGKVAIVTGGSEGVGYGCTHTLLAHGIEKLFILSVSQEVVDNSLKAIEEEMGPETAKKVTWLQCDLSDWKKTKETADKIASSTDRIDILINNAARGIMTYQVTDYGVDRHVSSNYIAEDPANVFADGNEPHGSRNSDLPPPPHHEENRLYWFHRPHCQPRFQRPPIDTLRLQIRIARRAEPRSRSKCSIRPLKACNNPLRPLPRPTPHLLSPQHLSQCHPSRRR